jgi:hypothetical protein
MNLLFADELGSGERILEISKDASDDCPLLNVEQV